MSSAYCEQEVTYAGELGKRIVPVLRQPVEDSEIPTAIRERNWIPFTEDGEFDSAADRVVQALDTDLEHRKEHTRWLIKSIEWDSEGRDRSFLLRGSELKAAENWQARTPVDADPTPTYSFSPFRSNNSERVQCPLSNPASDAISSPGPAVLALASYLYRLIDVVSPT